MFFPPPLPALPPSRKKSTFTKKIGGTAAKERERGRGAFSASFRLVRLADSLELLSITWQRIGLIPFTGLG